MTLRYVRFGVENPNLYRAMFHARLSDPLESLGETLGPGDKGYGTYAALHLIKLDAYESLVIPLEEMQRVDVLREGDPREFGLAVAALVHGLVGEFIDEGLGKRFSRDEPWSEIRQEMAQRVVWMLLEGLARPAG